MNEHKKYCKTVKMSRFDGTRGPPEISGMTSLKVDNLTYRTTMDDLEKYVRRRFTFESAFNFLVKN